MEKENKALLQCIVIGGIGDGKSKIIGELADGTDCLLRDLNIPADKTFDVPPDNIASQNGQKTQEVIASHRFVSLKRKFVIAEIPESINDLEYLERLDLSYNFIKKIENIHKLSNLKVLNLRRNRIKRIRSLPQNLEIFDISENKITFDDNEFIIKELFIKLGNKFKY